VQYLTYSKANNNPEERSISGSGFLGAATSNFARLALGLALAVLFTAFLIPGYIPGNASSE
jgi:hypothetical protein